MTHGFFVYVVLDLGIEMLFYVEEGAFSRREIQNVAATLLAMGKVLKNFD